VRADAKGKVLTLSKSLISSSIASDDTTLPPGESTRNTTALTCLSFFISRRERMTRLAQLLSMEPSTVTTAIRSHRFEGHRDDDDDDDDEDEDASSSGRIPKAERIIDVAVLDPDNPRNTSSMRPRLRSTSSLLFSMSRYLDSVTDSVASNLR